MGVCQRPGNAPAPCPRWLLLVALALCCLLAQPQPSQAAAFFFGVRTSLDQRREGGGGGREEKVPMTVVVPDPDNSPRPAPLIPSPSPSPAPVPAPMPVPGSGDDEDGTPRLPSERRSTVPSAGAPWSANHHSASAQAPSGEATSADFISSSPAVPLPAGVTDSATVLPMPTPGGHQLRDDVAMGNLRLEVRAVVQLAVPALLMMLSFGWS